MPNIEILISDNNSSDETQTLVQEKLRDGVPLRYQRNIENIGADRNFLQCFELARGKYVWIVGDDDVIVPGAIAQITRYLLQDEYDLVYVSSCNFEDVHELTTDPVQATKPILITRATDLARRVHVFFTFISGNIINKDRVIASVHPPFVELANSNLIQLGWTYTALRNHRKSLFFEDKLVAAKAGNTGGYGLFRVFGSNLKKVTEDWLGDRKLVRIILNATLQSFLPPYILAMRSSTAHNFAAEDSRVVLGPIYRRRWRYWVFVYPLSSLPLSVAKIWSYFLRAINKLDRLLGQPLLRFI